MRFIIDGTEYATDDIGELTQRDMLAMSKQAQMGVQTWARTVSQIERLALAPSGEGVVVLSEDEAKATPERVDPDLLFDSEPHLRAFFVMVWLARRTSGQSALTFDESLSLPFSRVEFLPDVEDDEPEDVTPDPPFPASAQADAPVVEASTPS